MSYAARSGLKYPLSVETLQTNVVNALRHHYVINDDESRCHHSQIGTSTDQVSMVLEMLEQLELLSRQGVDRLAQLTEDCPYELVPPLIRQILYTAGVY